MQERVRYRRFRSDADFKRSKSAGPQRKYRIDLWGWGGLLAMVFLLWVEFRVIDFCAGFGTTR